MPDEKTETAVADRGIKIVPKLVIKHLGDPAKFMALMPDNQQEGILGWIYGAVSAIKRGRNPDQMTFHNYLVGTFEATPSDKTKEIAKSGKCILREELQTPIEEFYSVTDEKTGEVITDAKRKGNAVEFGFEVHLIRSTNASKYTYAFKPIQQAQAADPLANLRALTTGIPASVPQITDELEIDPSKVDAVTDEDKAVAEEIAETSGKGKRK